MQDGQNVSEWPLMALALLFLTVNAQQMMANL